MADDQAVFVAEFKASGLKTPISVPDGHDAKSVPLNKSTSWYGGAEARRVADILVSYQTPAGGWSKNIDFSKRMRKPGERFSHDGGSQFTDQADNDRPLNASWSYVGTFDNDATITELRYIAKVIAALPASSAEPYRAAFSRGLEYIQAAQYPNGGWPQVWPLEGGYHDAITYNDDAMLHVLAFQHDVAAGQNEYAFVVPEQRALAEASFLRGLNCLLACQIKTTRGRTIWCQQHDMLTLAPCSARNYEMPSQASAESAGILMFLTRLQKPSPEVNVAIKSAAEWFEQTAINGLAFRFVSGERRLVESPGNGPIWARYYEIGTNRPLFGDRDKTIHDNVGELSRERRNGYAWFNDHPKRVLEHYDHWLKTGPIKPNLQ
jgi:PelA/Pel-15E family pectate lyase